MESIKPDFLSPSAFLKLLLKGDKRCRFQITDDVQIVKEEEGGRHSVGTEGIVIGCMYLDDPIQFGRIKGHEVYFILWDADPVPTIGGGWRYGPANTPQ